MCLDAVLEADLRCTAVLPDAVGSNREQHRRPRRRHGSQQLLSRSCLLTRPRTHHALEQGYRSVLAQFVLLVAQLVCANRGRPCALENNEIGRVLRDT